MIVSSNRHRLRIVATAMAVAVLTASFTASALAAPSQSGDDEPLVLAFIAPDLKLAVETGYVDDPGDPGEQFQAFVDDLNDRGGIGGRTVRGEFTTYDVVGDIVAAERKACLEATEDNHAFAVLSSSFFGDPILCVTQQHKTPLILANGTAQQIIDKSQGRLFLLNFSFERAIASSVQPLAKLGALKGKKLAYIVGDTPGERDAVETGLSRALKRHKIELSDEVVLPGVGGDDTRAAIQPAIQRLQDEGIDGIFVATNAIVTNIFMTAAEQAGFKPTYFTSDFSEGSSDALAQRVPKTALAGARGTSWRATGGDQRGEAPSAFDEQCNETFAEQTGTSYEPDSSQYAAVAQTCALVRAFESGATAAGSTLTPKTLTRGLRSLSSVDLPGGPAGSFGPGKFDAPDQVRALRYDGKCECWVPEGNFQPVTN